MISSEGIRAGFNDGKLFQAYYQTTLGVEKY
jgi:hypothetical protein